MFYPIIASFGFRCRNGAVASVFAAVVVVSGLAQAAAPVLPGASDAGRRIPTPESKPSGSEAGRPQVISDDAANLQDTAPPKAKEVALHILSIALEEGQALPKDEVDAILSPLQGKEGTLYDVYHAADALTARYRAHGYLLSRVVVPPQRIRDGKVVLRAIEGYARKVTLDGALRDSDALHGIAARIEAMHPLDVRLLETELLRIQLMTGQLPKALISPVPEDKNGAAVDLTITVDNAPVQGVIGFDDYGSRYAGPFQLSAGVTLHPSAIASTDILGVTAADTDELVYGSLTQHFALGTYGAQLAFTASLSKVAPGFRLSTSDVESKAQYFSMLISQPVILTRSEQIRVHAQMDIKNVQTDLAGLPLIEDHLRVVRVGADASSYALKDMLIEGNIQLSQGLSLAGASREGELMNSRAGAGGDFTAIRGEISAQRALTSSLGLFCTMQGQWASESLLSSEEFGFGGTDIGRGYDPSELLGDHGLSALAELRYDAEPWFDQWQPQWFVYYDVGRVWNIQPGGETSHVSGSSAGAGLRTQGRETPVEASLWFATPLTRPAEAPLFGASSESPRLMGSVRYRF